MHQNSVKSNFCVWDEKVSSRPHLGINYIPGVFQPFVPEQNLHLCLFSFWVCTLFNGWHWGCHTLFNWWHWWCHTHWWGPGCTWLCHPEWNLPSIGATGLCSLRTMLAARSLFSLCEQNGETLYSKADFLKVLSCDAPPNLNSSRPIWKSYSEKFIY